MEIVPISNRLVTYLKKHKLDKLFQKQLHHFLQNPFHPSLHTKVLEPKHLHLYCFRVTRSYRAIFIYRAEGVVEVIDINNHYQ
jgi:plasmid maintenance system killer protein